MTNKTRQRIIITGANGTIGSILTPALKKYYEVIQLDRKISASQKPGFGIDISESVELENVFRFSGDIECVIHLAANAGPESPWEEVLKNNITGTKNIYEASRKNGVKKIIFASSTHLLGGYEGYPQKSPLGRLINTSDPLRPDGFYGLSKGIGELIARQYYDLYGIRSICLRIGAVDPANKPFPPYEKLWLSHRDTIQIFRKALETDITFGIYFATSGNKNPIFDISSAKKELGYLPIDGL